MVSDDGTAGRVLGRRIDLPPGPQLLPPVLLPPPAIQDQLLWLLSVLWRIGRRWPSLRLPAVLLRRCGVGAVATSSKFMVIKLYWW